MVVNYEDLIAAGLVYRQPAKQICGAKTRKGTPCQCKPLRNGRCKFHGGMSTGPRTREGRANISTAQKRRWAKLHKELDYLKNARAREGERKTPRTLDGRQAIVVNTAPADGC